MFGRETPARRATRAARGLAIADPAKKRMLPVENFIVNSTEDLRRVLEERLGRERTAIPKC
jgi:hypothetical protein